ncbi:hypothetical protein ACWEF6_21135 [Amycolatopsis sp. NPDC004772]
MPSSFSQELPVIRANCLTYDFGKAVPVVRAVATSLRDRDGQFVASVGIVAEVSLHPQCGALGEQLREAGMAVEL